MPGDTEITSTRSTLWLDWLSRRAWLARLARHARHALPDLLAQPDQIDLIDLPAISFSIDYDPFSLPKRASQLPILVLCCPIRLWRPPPPSTVDGVSPIRKLTLPRWTYSFLQHVMEPNVTHIWELSPGIYYVDPDASQSGTALSHQSKHVLEVSLLSGLGLVAGNWSQVSGVQGRGRTGADWTGGRWWDVVDCSLALRVIFTRSAS